ncbi:pilus assembly protein TadG-related protein [Ornithinimicrobium flavum]|uniref:pilus assembly protein TadG-related protein n=1 Tax=Ornithinimicrobium flavum TaxID=1288636 RepID=UPI0013050746|nr:pilus assembly protein TadG-related protein [Ornithinimicrobium flavum]
MALTLLVLVGFTGLGVDVTSAYAKSQEVQNAADAAALGTAQHCAQEGVVCTDGSEEVRVTDLAQGNVRLQTVTASDTYPTSNRVTVEVSVEHENYFAGAVGFPSFTVVREATAEWFTPTAGSVLPLTISMCSFLEQTSGEPDLGEIIEIWQPQGGGGSGGGGGGGGSEDSAYCGWHEYYPPGGFGWLLPDDTTTCEVDIILDDGTGEPDEPGMPGMDPPNCISTALAPLQDGPMTVLLPIFDAREASGGNAEYRLVRFAALELHGIEFQTKPDIPTGFTCLEPKPPNPPEASPGRYYADTCLRGQFGGWVELGDDFSGEGPPSEISVIRLVDPGFAG